MSTKGGPVFIFSLPGGWLAPCPSTPVNYPTDHSTTMIEKLYLAMKVQGLANNTHANVFVHTFGAD